MGTNDQNTVLQNTEIWKKVSNKICTIELLISAVERRVASKIQILEDRLTRELNEIKDWYSKVQVQIAQLSEVWAARAVSRRTGHAKIEAPSTYNFAGFIYTLDQPGQRF